MEIKHTDGKFFVEQEDKEVAQMTYHMQNGKMVIDHTEVGEELQGQGVGSKLVDKAVEYARHQNLKIIPVCAYARKKMHNSDKYNDVLSWHPEK